MTLSPSAILGVENRAPCVRHGVIARTSARTGASQARGLALGRARKRARGRAQEWTQGRARGPARGQVRGLAKGSIPGLIGLPDSGRAGDGPPTGIRHGSCIGSNCPSKSQHEDSNLIVLSVVLCAGIHEVFRRAIREARIY